MRKWFKIFSAGMLILLLVIDVYIYVKNLQLKDQNEEIQMILKDYEMTVQKVKEYEMLLNSSSGSLDLNQELEGKKVDLSRQKEELEKEIKELEEQISYLK